MVLVVAPIFWNHAFSSSPDPPYILQRFENHSGQANLRFGWTASDHPLFWLHIVGFNFDVFFSSLFLYTVQILNYTAAYKYWGGKAESKERGVVIPTLDASDSSDCLWRVSFNSGNVEVSFLSEVGSTLSPSSCRLIPSVHTERSMPFGLRLQGIAEKRN